MAQTIESTWVPQVGDSMEIYRVFYESNVDAGSDGLNQFWDFSSFVLDSAITSIEYIREIENPIILATFPDASYASETTLSNGRIDLSIFGEENAALINYGFLRGFDPSELDYALFAEPSVVFEFPFELNDKFTNTTKLDYFNSDGTPSITSSRCTSEIIEFDAIGTVKTSFGEFEDCIRVKRIAESTNCIDLDDIIISIHYDWYYMSLSNKVMTINESFINNQVFFKNITFQSNVNATTTSLNKTSSKEAQIFYNGNGSFSSENMLGQHMASIYSMNGQLINSKELLLHEQSAFNFDLGPSSKTVYFLLLMEPTTGNFRLKKFIH